MKGWGGIFAEGETDDQLIEEMRERMPAVINTIEAAYAKFPKRLPSGQGAASMTDDSHSVKVLLAIAVLIAAEKFEKELAHKLLTNVCTLLWASSRLSAKSTQEIEEWFDLTPIKPGSQLSWDSALKAAKTVEPRRDSEGNLTYTHFDISIRMNGRDLASYLRITWN